MQNTGNNINFNIPIKPTKLIIYSRVSSKKQYNDANGLDYQDMVCENYIKEIFGINSEEVNYYCDVGSSYNSIFRLKDLNLMIKDLVPNSIIVVSEISRLGRNVCQVIPMFKKIRDKKCWVISVTEGLCFNKSRLMDKQIYQKIVDAERESDLISMRTSNANKLIKLNGGHVGRVPYGKQKIKVNGIPILTDCKDEQEIISYIKSLYNVHKDVNIVKAELEKREVTKRNIPWSIDSIKKIIKPTVSNITTRLNNFKISVGNFFGF